MEKPAQNRKKLTFFKILLILARNGTKSYSEWNARPKEDGRMRIDDPNLKSVGGAGNAAPVERISSRQIAEEKGLSSRFQDDVEISNLGGAIQDLQESSTSREEKVARLQKLYESGNYKVDAAEVASKLVDDALLNSDTSTD
jgi:flagellar biosynthesis anti-sigma factor FlgM